MAGGVPRIGRPRAWPAKAAAWASSNTWSSGVSAASAISWPTTRLLLRQVFGIESGPQHQVGGDGHGQRQAASQGADLEAGPLVAGGGVDLAALGLDGLDDVAGRASAGALEDHVLEQVRPAGPRRVLPARAAAGDDAERQGLEAGGGVADRR